MEYSGRAKTAACSATIASETYHRAGLVIASKTAVRCIPSGLSAADTITLVSMTSRSGIIGVWICEQP
jgi:hypothetical protein